MDSPEENQDISPLRRFKANLNFKMLLAVLLISIIAGAGTGFFMAGSGNGQRRLLNRTPDSASEDTKTFRDFAEGKITKKPEEKKNGNNQGTHHLVRDGATPVLLTSSVLDLAEYENKKVKVYGETNSLPGTGWFMDVGRIEVIQ